MFKHTPGEVMVLIQNFLFHFLYISIAIKGRLLTFNMLNRYKINIYLLVKGGYVFGGVGLSVCLFVCLFVDNNTQKVMNGLGF